jgi:hypothetical protein
VQAWRLIFFKAQTTMEQHIAIYSIGSQNLTQTISLLYEVYLKTGQYPEKIVSGDSTYRWDKTLAHKLATNAINEQEYTHACKY